MFKWGHLSGKKWGHLSCKVTHAFQKKAKKGIETPKHDVDLIKQRYKEAKEIEKNEQEENKNRV